MRRQDVQKLLAQVWQLIEVYRNRPGDIGFVSRALAIALALNVGGGMSIIGVVNYGPIGGLYGLLAGIGTYVLMANLAVRM